MKYLKRAEGGEISVVQTLMNGSLRCIAKSNGE